MAMVWIDLEDDAFYEAIIERDPREFPRGYVMSAFPFLWFSDEKEMREGFWRLQIQTPPEGLSVSELEDLDIEVTDPAIVDKITEVFSAYFADELKRDEMIARINQALGHDELEWWGTYDELRQENSKWGLQVRGWFRDNPSATYPITADEENEFVMALKAYPDYDHYREFFSERDVED